MKSRKLILLFIFSLCFFCGKVEIPKFISGYDLKKPDLVSILPDTLREVSGVTYADSTTLACVQDENGIIFLYDSKSNKVKQQVKFYGNGDYEGLACVGNTIYVLRSDGTLFEVQDFRSKKFKLTIHATGIPAPNNEGLCYDEENNRLLIACKSKSGKGRENINLREIYAFDLASKKSIKEAVYQFDVNAIKQFVVNQNIKLPVKMKKSAAYPILRFTTSAIAIHPGSKKLYLISSVDRLLFVFNKNAEPEQVEQLDPVLFNKPEGIIFFPNGEMVITNEAQGRKARLMRFEEKS